MIFYILINYFNKYTNENLDAYKKKIILLLIKFKGQVEIIKRFLYVWIPFLFYSFVSLPT